MLWELKPTNIQIFTSVSITGKKTQRTCFLFLLEYTPTKQKTELVFFVIKMYIIFANVIITSTARYLSVFFLSFRINLLAVYKECSPRAHSATSRKR